MSADQAPPRAIALSPRNRATCARIGVRLDGKDMGQLVIAYDVAHGWIRVRNVGGFGTILRRGAVEPYWRRPA